GPGPFKKFRRGRHYPGAIQGDDKECTEGRPPDVRREPFGPNADFTTKGQEARRRQLIVLGQMD
ncbi:MAG: hypothetical protein PVJ76_03460, partial [Gemmatimonadota bacterium]